MAGSLAPAPDPWDSVSVWIRHAGRYPCRPEWRIEPYVLGHYCLFHIEKGRGFIEREGTSMEARPGDLFIWRPDRRYSARHDPHRPFTVLSAGFNLPRPGRADALRPWALPDRLRLPAKARRSIEAAYGVLIEDFGDGSGIGRLAARGSLMKLVAETLRWANTLPAARRLGGPPPPPGGETRAAAVQRYIEKHLAKRLTLRELARTAHLSPVYFAALFRRQTGQSPMAYVRRRRMEVARALLLEGDAGVEQVARVVGYDDPFHFSRLFRRLVGQAPSAYRESFKNPFLR